MANFITLPPTTPKKPIYGAFYGLSGYGVYQPPIRKCDRPDAEMWSDADMNCDDTWSDNSPGYTGSIEHSDSKYTITASNPNPDFYSIVPDNVNIQAGKYLLEAVITDINATNGWKWSVRAPDNTWHNLITGTTTGSYKQVVDVGDIVNVNIGHNSAVDGESITFDVLRMTAVNETRTPCLTGYTAPYGICSASHELTDYWAWKGMDCSNTSTRDCWVTPSIPHDDVDPTNEEVWFEWQLTDDDLAAGMSPMIPTKVVISPRVGMSESWWTANNPYKMRFKGIRVDGSMFDIMDYQTDDWIGSGSRTIDLPLTEECRGLRIVVLGTKGWESGGACHTGFGASYFEGVYSNTVTHEGEIVYFNNEVVVWQS